MSREERSDLGKALLVGAMAGGLGWGIRGQFGHETGAMMAGLLVGLTLLLFFCPHWMSLSAARAVALMTIGIGFGGSETYGQTVGLTHDAPLVGNWSALGWGLLGLAIKGGVWIGFAGAFLGMGLSGKRYHPMEMVGIFVAMMGLYALGVWLVNTPYDPANRILPRIYFSDDWRWEPDSILKPRRERWGGLWLALAGLLVYTRWIRQDRLASRLTTWAMLGGALGFPLGQCVQAFHAWNREIFREGFLARIDSVINWWNMMETTFGAVFGTVLALGVWRNRSHIRELMVGEAKPNAGRAVIEVGLLVGYVALLICWEFFDVPYLNALAEPGISMGLLPAIGIVMGRWWPYAVVLPLTLIPIAGKTVRQLCYKEHLAEPMVGWLVYGIVPLVVAMAAMLWVIKRSTVRPAANEFLRTALLVNVWLYFGLNFAFFHYPWPWSTWTVRTPNALIYLLCALGLTAFALRQRSRIERRPVTNKPSPVAGESGRA
jgi:hypothetical protein